MSTRKIVFCAVTSGIGLGLWTHNPSAYYQLALFGFGLGLFIHGLLRGLDS